MRRFRQTLRWVLLGMLAIYIQCAAKAGSPDQIFLTDGRTRSVPLPFKPGITFAQVFLQRGGMTDPASAKFRLIRDGKSEKVDFRAILNGDISKDRLLQPGDILSVDPQHLPFTF